MSQMERDEQFEELLETFQKLVELTLKLTERKATKKDWVLIGNARGILEGLRNESRDAVNIMGCRGRNYWLRDWPNTWMDGN